MSFNKTPEIKSISEINLMGIRSEMTLAQDKTLILWKKFVPVIGKIKNRVNKDFLDVQIYNPEKDFNNFDQNTVFEKWVGVEVSAPKNNIIGLEFFVIPKGKYAVFSHKGRANESFKIMYFIYAEWLPGSGYSLDKRPHFQILKEGYKPDDPESEETIWVPLL